MGSRGKEMRISDWINPNVLTQLLVAGIAVWAVLASLHATRKQIRSSEKQVREQIEASDRQVLKQIEESRRLATEERQQQTRPLLAPKQEIGEHGVMSGEDLYRSDGVINWGRQSEIEVKLYNMGNGPAFNIHALLYGAGEGSVAQFVAWDQGPLEEKGVIPLPLVHSSELRLLHDDSVDGKHRLYDRSPDTPMNPYASRMACLTLTYQDLLGKKYVSIFQYTLQHQWTHVVIKEIEGESPLDLKELNTQKAGRQIASPKVLAPPVTVA
jgi:hypothetical protein